MNSDESHPNDQPCHHLGEEKGATGEKRSTGYGVTAPLWLSLKAQEEIRQKFEGLILKVVKERVSYEIDKPKPQDQYDRIKRFLKLLGIAVSIVTAMVSCWKLAKA